jgi:hypothetical protein
MAHEVKLTSGKGSMEQRIADRLRPSNDMANADQIAQHGSGPTRAVTAIHHGGTAKKHGSDGERE